MDLTTSHLCLRISTNGQLSIEMDGKHSWANAGPFVVLHYFDRQHPRAQVVSAPSGDGYNFGTAGTPSLSATGELHTQTIDPNDGSLRVTAEFPSIQIRIVMNITLTKSGDGFSVAIEEGGVREGNPGLYRIMGLEILPQFGAARSGDSGYLTLPNWSGCQTFFDKSYPREVRQTIYSSNDQWEHVCNMPVFGITREQGTLCGIVTAGDYDAQLISRVHWEAEEVNCTHPYLVYRWEQQDERIAGRREVRYAFSPAEYEGGEGYVFCAKTYREFLYNERGLLTWEQKAQTHPAVLDYRDRFFLKVFMAYKDPQADGRGKYHATCNFAQARGILEDCLKRGITKLTVVLVGWGQDGHDGMPPQRFPVDERLGGEAAFRELIAWCREQDIMLAVHDSYGEGYTCSPAFVLNDVIQHRTGESWQGIVWSGGQVHKLCPSVFVDKHTKHDVPAIRALGIYGHHHVDAIGSFMTCYAKDHPVESREAYTKEIRRMFGFIRDEMGSVSTEMPFGPYFDVVDGFYHSYSKPSPWHRASTVGRYFLDRSIPLLHIVLHGSVNCGEGIHCHEETPLHWLDWGGTPQWEVCTVASESFGIPTYASVSDELEAFYKRYYSKETPLIERLSGLQIEGRWELTDTVTRTRYSDGTTVTVNNGNDVWEGIPANDYLIQTEL